jgi:RND superfamily putative drug exporter
MSTSAPRDGLFARLGRFTFRHRWIIAGIYAVLVVPLIILGLPVFSKLKGGGFEDPKSESFQVYLDLEREIKVGGADILALYTARDTTVDDIEPYTAAIEAITRVEKDPDVVTTASWYTTQAPQLISKDKKRTFILIALRGDDGTKAVALQRLKPLLEAPPMELQLGGVIPVNSDVAATIADDLKRAELIAFPITAILLLIFFGSATSAALPLTLGALSIAMALAFLRVLTMFTSVSIFAVNLITLLGLGLAIDYSLFIVNRYREELPSLGVEGAIIKTIATTGRAVAFSGVTVAASLIGLYAFPQMFLHSMALGGIAVVLGAVALAVTLLPALLAILGTRINSLKIPFASIHLKDVQDSFWHKIAYGVMKRPILVAVAVAGPLIVLGVPFLRFNPSFPDYRILPPDHAAYIANATLDREFEGKQMTPIDVLVKTPGRALDKANLEKLYEISQRLEKLPHVKQVSGLFTIIPNVPRDVLLEKLSLPADKQDPTVQLGINAFSHDSYFRFAVLLDITFNEPESIALVREIRTWEVPGFEINVGGPCAFLIDLRDRLVERSPIMIAVVCCVMFLVLFFVFGSVTLPLKAMFMNALSLTASFGAIVWVFQDGRFHKLLRYEPLGISDCTAPLLMFSIVFGLSMDYEVLLLSRVREEYVRCGDNEAAVAHGLARTGSLITRAALLLFVVIVAFGTSHIIFMKSLGLGMALAILLDATIVRGLLVPATMKLMGKWNWWAPGFMVDLWHKAGLSDLESE